MCINSLMIDTDIIQCLLDDLIDRICLLNNSSSSIKTCSILNNNSTKLIENKFNQSINLLNNSLKQLLKYEFNTVQANGNLTTTLNIRHSRYYNPATTIKQTNDLKKRLQWIQQRQFIVKQFNLNQEKNIQQTNVDLNSMENLWFNQRLQMLNNSLDLLNKKDENFDNENDMDETTCSRCRIYQRKKPTDTHLFEKIKHIYQVHNEHNYSKTDLHNSNPESDFILSLSKIADRIGHNTISNVSNSSKKLSTSTTIKKKQQQQPKLQSSISLIVADSNKNNKRTIEESRNISNSNFISNNYDITSKRQKRIASPQSSLSVSSSGTPGPISSSSPHEILTPTWRTLTTNDLENSSNVIEKSNDQQETEDILDESYIRRHIRCELEQESWITNPPISKNVSLTSNRKSGTLQTSLSVPNGLSSSTTTTNPKQYRYRLTSDGIAYTELIDTK